jgi:hypothetical protein
MPNVRRQTCTVSLVVSFQEGLVEWLDWFRERWHRTSHASRPAYNLGTPLITSPPPLHCRSKLNQQRNIRAEEAGAAARAEQWLLIPGSWWVLFFPA